MAVGIDTTFLVQAEVAESENHAAARRYLDRHVIGRRQALAIAPQALLEFIHVVTDGKRFEKPLAMELAMERSAFWWNAREIRQVFPSGDAFLLFQDWMRAHALGRRRVLDTFLAATYASHGIREILSSNARDYRIFPGITVIDPAG